MPLNITFLGHAGFMLKTEDHTLVIDPFLTGNESAKHKPEDITCQTIALTHGHQDHIGDTLEIATANQATVVAPVEVCNYLAEQGVQQVLPCNPGGQLDTDFGFIAYTPAIHSSSYEGRYMGVACGIVVRINDTTFYHLGDTTVFSDMKMLGEIYQPDIAAVPIGDRYTMGPQLATKATELIAPKIAIPIHYKTFPILKQSADGFSPKHVQVKELQPGESWDYQ